MATTLTNNYKHRTLSLEEIVEMLKCRGLTIHDECKAIAFLSDVSYFRLASYLRPFESDKHTHQYKDYASFEKAVELYHFDNALREIVFKAIQHIEVSLRTRMIQEFSEESDPFWFFDESQCASKRNYLDNMAHIERELTRSKEDFIKEHFRKYGNDCYPPAWKTLEIITFGCLSKLYGNYISTKAKKRIARSYGVPQHEILESWIKTFNAIRNACAHHARLWNAIMAQTPMLPSRMRNKWINNSKIDGFRIYAALSCLVYWLNAIRPENTFVKDFKRILSDSPNVDIAAMGFPADWRNEPLWSD
ncbi:MAG: Abi family protein [Veillonella sp.]|nr:Abi family protein [Veillonella sp.]